MSESNGHPLSPLAARAREWREVRESLSDFASFATGQDRLRGLDQNSAVPLVSSTRQDGQDRTLRLHHEADYNAHRANARLLVATNPYARALVRNLVNAVIGHGGTLDCDDKGILQFCEDWLAANSWNCSRVDLYDDSRVLPPKEVQALVRIYRDGEAWLRHVSEGGSTLVDFIDPERILGSSDEWHFGMRLDAQGRPVSYRVQWDFGEEEVIPASEMTFIPHPDTDSTVLRALPELVFGVRDLLISALKQTSNISLGVQLRAAICMVWEWAFNEDNPDPVSIMDQAASRTVLNEATGRRETVTQGGTVLNAPEGCKLQPLPTDQTASYREGVRTALEAVAGSQCSPYYAFGDSNTSNYATALQVGTPSTRHYEMWQSYMSRLTLRLLTRALREAVEEGTISESRVRKANLTYTYPAVATASPMEDAEAAALQKEAGIIDADEARSELGYDAYQESDR